MAKYLEIRERKILSVCDLEGELSEVSHYLGELANECGNDAYLSIDHYDDEIDVEVSWTRQETGIERDVRLSAAKKARAVLKAERAELENRERAELARLQEKYS